MAVIAIYESSANDRARSQNAAMKIVTLEHNHWHSFRLHECVLSALSHKIDCLTCAGHLSHLILLCRRSTQTKTRKSRLGRIREWTNLSVRETDTMLVHHLRYFFMFQNIQGSATETIRVRTNGRCYLLWYSSDSRSITTTRMRHSEANEVKMVYARSRYYIAFTATLLFADALGAAARALLFECIDSANTSMYSGMRRWHVWRFSIVVIGRSTQTAH